MPTATVGDTFLYYRTVGSGAPCLVMHGGLGIDHNAYSPGLDPLGDVLKVVFYDHRCHGRSGRPDPATISLAQLADDADGLRESLGAEQIGVLGHSFGGFVAFEYAVRHWTNLAFLIVVCSSPTVDYMAEVPDILEKRMTVAMRAELALPAPRSSQEWLRRTALLPLYFHHHRPAYTDALTARVIPNLEGARCSDLEGWTRWSDLSTLRVPTLLIAGRHDWIPHLRRLERLAQLMPAAELIVFEDSGHYPWLEEPETFMATIHDWIDKLPTRI